MPLADRLVRLAMTFAVVFLASVAAVVSWRHAYALALDLGEDVGTARVVPLTIDSMVLVGALTGLFCSRYGLTQPLLARVVLFLGIGATITVNCAHGMKHGVFAAIFAGWPALALVLSSELLLWVVAASRQLDRRAVIVVDQPEEERDPNLLRAIEMLTADTKMTAAALGRSLELPYERARLLAREARAVIAAA